MSDVKKTTLYLYIMYLHIQIYNIIFTYYLDITVSLLLDNDFMSISTHNSWFSTSEELHSGMPNTELIFVSKVQELVFVSIIGVLLAWTRIWEGVGDSSWFLEMGSLKIEVSKQIKKKWL